MLWLMREIGREFAVVFVLSVIVVAMLLGTIPVAGDGFTWNCRPTDVIETLPGWADRTLLLLSSGFTFHVCESSLTRGHGVLQSALITAQLVTLSMTVLLAIAIPLGVRSGMGRNLSVTRPLRQLVEMVSNLPILFWGTLLFVLLARKFDIIAGARGHERTTMAVAVLAVTLGDRLLIDLVQRVELATREILSEPYMRTVRAGGFGVQRHVMQGLVSPVATAVLSRAMFLISGAVVAELLIDLPGLGYLITSSLSGLSPQPRVALAASMSLIFLGTVLRVAHRIVLRLADARTTA